MLRTLLQILKFWKVILKMDYVKLLIQSSNYKVKFSLV